MIRKQLYTVLNYFIMIGHIVLSLNVFIYLVSTAVVPHKIEMLNIFIFSFIYLCTIIYVAI